MPTREFNINNFRHPALKSKEVTISILYMWETERYQVKHVTNTTWFRPGDWLTEDVVDQICDIDKWTIQIDSYELLQKIAGLLPKFSVLP